MKVSRPTFQLFFKLITTIIIATSAACTKDDTNEGYSEPDGVSPLAAFRTSCGTVFNGSLSNPPALRDGRKGQLTHMGPNLVTIKLDSGPLLVKLHGLDAPYEDWKRNGAKAVMDSLIREGDGYFFKADAGCETTLSDGGKGVIGHVFSATGKSFSESLIKRGYANSAYDSCGGDLIASCYAALEEETSNVIAGELEEFLWKPVSDSTGMLAIHSSPYDTTVIVNGETGANQGGGNGYASLARFSKPGCAYGSAKIKVVNSYGAAYLYKGQSEFIIPNGCQRMKLKNGFISADSK